MTQIIQKSPKISINVCTHRHMNPFFVNSLLFMMDYMRASGLRYEMNSHMGVSNICSGRQQRVNEAMASDCTHMLMIDDDMVFAQNMVHKMLHECNELVKSGITKVAMGVNAVRKNPAGLTYTAKGIDEEFTPGMEAYMQSKGKSGVAEVSRCGLGAFLIETQILREIPKPHFEILFNHEKDDHEGEDFYFIRKLREHGVMVFVDQDISQNMGHAGEFIYSCNSYLDAPKT